MRLLEEGSDGRFKLITKDLERDKPRYAILSHTWGPDAEEVTYRDIVEGTGENKKGYEKIKFCAAQAKRNGLQYSWVDTCCIDKSDNTELSTAITSMFRWYQKATRCYVYLSDVSTLSSKDDPPSQPPWESEFRASRWFTRGWTLQELLAPAMVEFFARDGQRLGDKRSLEQQIHEVTGIAVLALQRSDSLPQFDVEERFLWAQTRETTQEEDWAYCLLGIFGIFMPLMYGEGRAHAVQRLRKEIHDAMNRINASSHREGMSQAPSFPSPLHSAPVAGPAAGHAPVPCSNIPFRQNRRFVGRKETLNQLRDLLFAQKNQRVALVGLGGVGKTQVALELAHWTRQNKPDHSIFWVPVLSYTTFEQAYVEMGGMLPVQQRGRDEDIKQLIRQHLSSAITGPWLLILDNADDMDIVHAITQHLPESDNGHILVTTRSRDVALSLADGLIVDLEEMSLHEAKSVLQNGLTMNDLRDDAAVEELLRELAYLPLAISQAVAYLKRNKMSIATYLRLLRGAEKDMVSLLSREFPDSTRYAGSPNAVATTWLVSFDQIRQTDPDASDILSFISQIEPKAIPQSILPEVGSAEQMENAIGTLCGYAFLARRSEGEMFDMHSLVHVGTRIWIENDARMTEVEAEAIQRLSTIFPGPHPRHRERWRVYLPHALRALQRIDDSQSEERCLLSLKVGQCLDADRRYSEATGPLTDAYEWMKQHRSEKDHLRLAVEHELAVAWVHDRRHVQEGIELLEHVVRIENKTLEEEDHDRLVSQHVLAMAYIEGRRIDEAINILEHIVRIHNKTLEEEDHDRLASQHVLASAYIEGRRIDEAINILEHIVRIENKTLEEEDHNRLASQHELASAYIEGRRIDEAINILEHIVRIHNKTLEEEDHNRLTSQHVLARAYIEGRRIDEAINILEHVVRIHNKTLEEEDHNRLTSQHVLAMAYIEGRRIDEAINILEHIVRIENKTLKEEDHNRLTSQHELARAYIETGCIEEGLRIYERIVPLREKTLAEDDESRLKSEHQLARGYRIIGRTKEAIDIFEHVVLVRQKTLQEEDRYRLDSEHELAEAYLQGSRADEAVGLLEHVVRIRQQILPKEDGGWQASEEALTRALQAQAAADRSKTQPPTGDAQTPGSPASKLRRRIVRITNMTFRQRDKR